VAGKKTPQGPLRPPLPKRLIEEYEALRAQAIEGALAQGYGAAVLLHQGLYAWALAWEKSAASSPSAPTPRGRGFAPTGSLERALVQVLAAMVLSVQRERCHGSGTF